MIYVPNDELAGPSMGQGHLVLVSSVLKMYPNLMCSAVQCVVPHDHLANKKNNSEQFLQMFKERIFYPTGICWEKGQVLSKHRNINVPALALFPKIYPTLQIARKIVQVS